MNGISFDTNKEYDLILLGRVCIDLNPTAEGFYKPTYEVDTFNRYLGGSPANIAVGMARLGKKIGSVGYTDPAVFAKTIYTTPEQAVRFYEDTNVDAMAVSVGTLHRQVVQEAKLQFDRLDAIRSCVDVPLVIHGSTSVKNDELTVLAHHGVQKINLGTCLRLKFGNTLRALLQQDDKIFDRVEMFKHCMVAVKEEALMKMRLLNM